MEQWRIPTKIFAGRDSLKRLKRFYNKNILLICDPFLVGTVNLDYVTNMLEEMNRVSIYSEVVPDPPIASVEQGVEKFLGVRPQVLIVIGGGSAIDLAKAIRYFAWKLHAYEVEDFIAVPTTSGTGSEVTSFAVITDRETGIKYPLVDDSLLPTEAILTPLFVKGAPPHITAFSGMDVLAHAMEAYVSTAANTFTDALAEQVMQLVFQYLPACVSKDNTVEDRMRMHEASCMAGLAFNSAGLGITHAIAHQLGGQLHIPHGLANSMLLPWVIVYNAAHSDRARKKYANIARLLAIATDAMSEVEKVQALSTAVAKLAATIQCPQTVSAMDKDLAVFDEKLAVMVQAALQDMTYKTNPYKASEDDIREILTLVR